MNGVTYLIPSRKDSKRFAMVPIDERVLRCSGFDCSARVLLALMSFSNGGGIAWPKLRTIAEMTGLAIPHVSRAIKKLTRLGIVTRCGNTKLPDVVNGSYHIRQHEVTTSEWSILTDQLTDQLTDKIPPLAPPRKPKPSIDEWQPSEVHYGLGEQKGLSASEVDDQAESYLDWMRSTGKRHRDLNAGFRNWLKRERTPSHVNGRAHKPTAVENLYEGAIRAVYAREARRRAAEPAAEPLLDLGGPASC